MSVEEYSLKFSTLSMFSPSLVSNPRDEMSRFLTGIVDLVKEVFHTDMLHDDMVLDRLMVGVLETLIGVFQVIKVNLGPRRGLNLKKTLGVVR